MNVETLEDAELQALDQELEEAELDEARRDFSIYAGLMSPAVAEKGEDEEGELEGLHKLSMHARYLPAEHHRLICGKLDEVERGKIKRLMIFAPPGSAKSSYTSVLFGAYCLGKHPRWNIGQGSYNDDLATRFGRRSRNTFLSPEHQQVFPVALAKDSKAAGEWTTEAGGEYFSFGMNVGVTGRRFDGVILDDIVKGRKEADSKTVRDSTWETYKADVRTRLKPNAWIVYIATRWHEDDPAGRILPKEAMGKTGWFTAKDGERWYVISLAAVVETKEEQDADPLGRKIGEHLWPEWFSQEHFAQAKRTQGSRNWNALFQQKPRPDEGAILKKKHWRLWPGKKPPKCEFVVSIYDTAFEDGEEDDFSARTTWGIFWHEEAPEKEKTVEEPEVPGRRRKLFRPRPLGGHYCCILLERFKDKVEFPDLRKLAKAHYHKFQPDLVAVEKKSSGHSLIHELRRAGIPVRALMADRSKLLRAHSAAVVLEQGCVFYLDFEWAREVIDDCATATFQRGAPGNDIGDTCVYAWLLLRRKFHLELKDEAAGQDEDEENHQPIDEPRIFG